MSSLNRVDIIGRLGADPEAKTIASGTAVTRLSVATSDVWTDKDGQKQERTEWHRVVIWGKLAETCAKYLQKGRLVFVSGQIQTRSWEDQDGVKRYSTEIVAKEVKFLSPQTTEKEEAWIEPSFDTNEEISF